MHSDNRLLLETEFNPIRAHFDYRSNEANDSVARDAPRDNTQKGHAGQ